MDETIAQLLEMGVMNEVAPGQYALTEVGTIHVEKHMPDNPQAGCPLCESKG